MPAVTVRLAEPADAPALAAANIRSIREVCGADYPDPAHLDAWCANKTAANYEKWMLDPGQRIFAGLVDGEIAGVGIVSVAKGFVHVLYLVPEALGTGLGKALLARMEAELRAAGHGIVGLESTITARGFYLKQGYRELGETEVRGWPAYKMEKTLG